MQHANDQRNSAQGEAMAKEFIEITDDWWNALNSSAFVSCKFLILDILTTKNFFLLSRTQRQNHSLVEGKFEPSATTTQKAKDRSFGLVRSIPSFLRRAEAGGVWSSSWRKCFCRQKQLLSWAKRYWQRWRLSQLAKRDELNGKCSHGRRKLRAEVRRRRSYVQRHKSRNHANEAQQKQIKILSEASNCFSFFKLSSSFQ